MAMTRRPSGRHGNPATGSPVTSESPSESHHPASAIPRRSRLDVWREGVTGILAIVRVIFAQSGRERMLHLGRVLPALALCWWLWSTLWQVGPLQSSHYVDFVNHIARFLIGGVVAYAAFVSVAAGAMLAGASNRQMLNLACLSRLTPGRCVLGAWIGRLAVTAVQCAGAAPFLAALSLFGALDPATVPRGALALLLLAAMTVALGLAVSPRANDKIAGVGLALVAMALTVLVPPLLIQAIGGNPGLRAYSDTVRRLSPLSLLEPGRPILPPVATAAVVCIGLLVIASVHLRRRLAAAAAPAPARERAAAKRATNALDRFHLGRHDRGRLDRVRYDGDGSRLLAQVGAVSDRRVGRLVQRGWLLLLACSAVLAVTDSGLGRAWDGLFDALVDLDFRLSATLTLSYVGILLFVGGVALFWVRLERRGLLPLLRSGPLLPGDYLRSSWRVGLRFAALPWLLAGLLLAPSILHDGVTVDRWIVTGLGFLASLAVVVTTAQVESIGSAAGEARRGLQLHACICGGPLFMSVLLDQDFLGAPPGLVALGLGVALGAPAWAAWQGRRDPRHWRFVPAAVLGLTVPFAISSLQADGLSGAFASPLLSLAKVITDLAPAQYGYDFPRTDLSLILLVQLPGAAVLAWYARRGFDAVTRRVASGSARSPAVDPGSLQSR